MTADLSQFAPGDAHIQILLRTDRMRSSPHRGAVEYLLHHLPDYNTLVTGSALSPFDDLDALLIATSNPFDVTATFLAARHAADGRARNLLAARKLPSWDPRTMRFPEPTLSLLARPDSRPPAPPADGGTDEDPDVLEARWLRNLSHFERAAGDKNGPALLVDVEQLDALVHLGNRLPTPLALTVAATPAAAPLVRIRMQFAGDHEAHLFAELLPDTRRRMVEWRPLPFLPALGTTIPLAPLLDALQPQVSGSVVELVGELPAEPFARVLAWIPRLLPHQPVATASAGGVPSTASPSTYGTATPAGAGPPSTTAMAPLSPGAGQGAAPPAAGSVPPPVGMPGVMSRPAPIPPPPSHAAPAAPTPSPPAVPGAHLPSPAAPPSGPSTPAAPSSPAPPASPAPAPSGPPANPAPPAAPRPAAPPPIGSRSDAGARP